MCHCSPEKCKIGRTSPSNVDIFLKTMVEGKLSFDHLTIGIPAHRNKEGNRHQEPTISPMSFWGKNLNKNEEEEHLALLRANIQQPR